MPAALIHRLTHASQLQGTAVVCGAHDATVATWEVARVTCPACRARGLPAPPRGQKRAALRFPSEKAFQAAVKQLAQAHGWLYHHHTISLHSAAGWVDTVLVKGPRLVGAELKMPGNTPTAAQQSWLDALAAVREVQTAVWYPDDWPQIVEVLR